MSAVERQSVPVSAAERDSVIARISERAPEHADLDWSSLLRTVVSPLTIVRGIDPVVRDDHFWAVVADDLGVQYVVRASVAQAQAAPQD